MLKSPSRYEWSCTLRPLKHSTCVVPRSSTGSWTVSRSLSKCCRAYGLNRLQRQDLSQQMCSPTAPGRALQKITTAAALLSPGAVGRTPLSQVSYHPLNNASRLQTPDRWIPHSSSVPTLQPASDEAPHCTSVPVSGFIRCSQIFSSNPIYLFSHWPAY